MLALSPLSARSGAWLTIWPEMVLSAATGFQAMNIETVDLNSRNLVLPNNSVGIVIGGTEGLSRDDYRVLTARNNTYHQAGNNPDVVGQDEWVNCGIVWVKSAQDRLERWLQPKAVPAMEEWNTRYQHMFPGKATF